MIKWLARSYKTFTREEILKPFTNRPYKNLFEMAGSHKSLGVGFRFWRKTWPENSYFTITRVKLDDIRHGKAWGILTWKGVPSAKEEQIKSPLKLGTWQYSEKAQ